MNHSVLGRYLPWLFYLDADWTKANLEAILPIDDEYLELWLAGWGTYLQFCPAFSDMSSLLYAHYKLALARQVVKINRQGDTLGEYLSNHILTYYWRGEFDREIVIEFLALANEETRVRAIDFVGRNLVNTNEKPPSEVIKRIEELWDEIIQLVEAGILDMQESLAGFGGWFASNWLNDEKAINALCRSTSVYGDLRFGKETIKKLAKIAMKFPVEAISILDNLVRSSSSRWEILWWKEEAQAALAAIIESENVEASSKAKEVIDYLGKKGHLEFRETLKNI